MEKLDHDIVRAYLEDLRALETVRHQLLQKKQEVERLNAADAFFSTATYGRLLNLTS